MSTQYKGSVLSSTEQPTSSSSAKGIWTTSDVMQAQKAATWPLLILPISTIEYLMVAGGGGGGYGGSNSGGGGGGGGGILTATSLSVSTGTSYSMAIGAGGPKLVNGTNTTFAGGTAFGGAGGVNIGGTAGTANLGGGGGGAGGSTATGANGGSGVIIVAYLSSYPSATAASAGLIINGSAGNITPDTASRAGYKIYRITAGTGTITW